MKEDKLTKKIIGCAIRLHKELGPGLLESAYEECLSYLLQKEGLSVQRQIPIQMKYEEVILDFGYRMDILVEDQVVIELKSVELLNQVHEAQILTYLKFSNKEIGLLMNFNVVMLKEGIRRFIMTPKKSSDKNILTPRFAENHKGPQRNLG